VSSFFRRVTRFPLGSALDPRENRLTEITAAVFDEVPSFARDVAALLLAEDSGPEAANKPTHPHFSALNLRVQTQKTTFSQKFVDLEVRLSPAPFAGGDTQLLWVEVKHGAGSHGSQLRDYLDDIERESADVRHVVILAPRNAMPTPADVPAEILVVEWQAVGRVLDRWRRRRDHGPVQRFLLDQYAAYLLEEGLMDEGRLTAEHAFVLSAQPATADVAATLCELADAHVQMHWGPRGDDAKRGAKPAFGIDYWAHYPRHAAGSAPAPDTWGDSTFEWSLR
jgi:hypothetical protein